MGNCSTKDELWDDKEDVQILTGLRDKINILCISFPLYNCKLLSADGAEICAISLKEFKSKGTMTVGKVEYKMKHSAGSDKWELVLGNKVVCGAKQPGVWRTKLLLDEYDENGSVQRRLRMQTREWGGQKYDFYETPTDSTDEEAMKGGSLYMSIAKSYPEDDWDVKKVQDDVSDVFLAFSFFIFVIFYRRRSEEKKGTFGSIGMWRRFWLFANFLLMV